MLCQFVIGACMENEEKEYCDVYGYDDLDEEI